MAVPVGQAPALRVPDSINCMPLRQLNANPGKRKPLYDFACPLTDAFASFPEPC